MRYLPHRWIGVGLAVALSAGPLMAQSPTSQQRLEQGIEAFRAERYGEAQSAFEQAIAVDETNAEAYYMLSRVYYETPLFDKGLAGKYIGQARKLNPDAVEYMVAELQQLRLPSWNNIAEFIQQEKRRELAQRILSVDSTNAFAHEELGATYIRDFWEYRNAIAFPTLEFAESSFGRDERNNDTPSRLGTGTADDNEDRDSPEPQFADPSQFGSEPRPVSGAMGTFDLSDRFDIETLQEQGAAVLDLSKRADRAYEAAVGHLESALRYDPRRRPVYDHLMRIHALNEAYSEALDVLGRMYVFFPEDAQMWTYLGLANVRTGNVDAAAKSFSEAFERMDDEERRAFGDLTMILSEEEQALYAEDPVGYAARYWTSQDPRYLTPYNERRLEHYARLVYADLLYAAPDIDLRGWQTQRGGILVRYGPPTSEVTVTGAFGEVINAFGFSAAASRMESGRQFGERFDMLERSNVFNIWDYGDFRFVFEDPIRNGEYRLYSPPADLFADASAGFVETMDYEMIARRTFREQPERYRYEAPGRDIRIPYLATAFKGDDGEADVYVHYGIPLGEDADLDQDLINLTVRTGTFLIDDTRKIVAERRRTLYGLSTSQVASFQEARLWTNTQQLEARPGPHTVSVEFETASRGAQAAQRREIDVPNYDTGSLALSDLMLAYQVEEEYGGGEDGVDGGRVRRGDFVIQPAPWSVYSAEQPIYVYFETYNLQPDAAGQNQYAVEVALRPKDTSSGIARLAKRVFGSDDGGVAIEFEAGGTGPDDATYTILDAADQEPGLYTLTLRVRDAATGRTDERTTDLFLE